MNYKQIITSIRNKELEPVYFLMGDEPYYIDKLCDEFGKNILSLEQQEFNQVTLYAENVTIQQIISEAKQFPFGSEKRVVIIKEAQKLRNIEIIENYLEYPQKSTILVIAYKGKSIDRRKKFGRNLPKKCVVFESKKLYESRIPDWISEYVNKHEYKIDTTASLILAEHLGVDLSKITNELDKIMLVVKKEELITKETIEKHIGISKDYNIFELQNSLIAKDIVKANRIINHFSKDTKNHHIVPIISSLFIFFEKIMTYHFLNEKNPQSIAAALKINPFFVSQYQKAARNYTKKQLFFIFENLKKYDLRSKGVKNKSTTQGELLKELVFKILHA